MIYIYDIWDDINKYKVNWNIALHSKNLIMSIVSVWPEGVWKSIVPLYCQGGSLCKGIIYPEKVIR